MAIKKKYDHYSVKVRLTPMVGTGTEQLFSHSTLPTPEGMVRLAVLSLFRTLKVHLPKSIDEDWDDENTLTVWVDVDGSWYLAYMELWEN